MADEPEQPPQQQPPPPQPPRAEMYDAPPFLTWRAIYLIVVGALAVQVVAGALITALYR